MNVFTFFVVYFLGILDAWMHIWRRCEPGESIFVHVESQGTDAGQSYVYSQIALEAIDKKRILNIMTGYQALTRSVGHLGKLVCNRYAFSLRALSGFDNPVLVRVFFHFHFQDVCLFG